MEVPRSNTDLHPPCPRYDLLVKILRFFKKFRIGQIPMDEVVYLHARNLVLSFLAKLGEDLKVRVVFGSAYTGTTEVPSLTEVPSFDGSSVNK